MPKIEVGVVGFGQMGRYFATLIRPFANVMAFDPDPLKSKRDQDGNGIEFRPLEEVCANRLVLLFPPISKFKECWDSVRSHLHPDSLIVEFCSVMDHPMKIMEASFSAKENLLGCHPLFGPQSGRNGVENKTIILSPSANPKFAAFEGMLSALGLSIIRMTPLEHDGAMARTQALELLIGRLLIDLPLQKERVSTPGYDLLLELKEMLQDDSIEILNGTHRHNPLTAPLREMLVPTLQKIVFAIEEGIK